MSGFHLIILFWVILSMSWLVFLTSASWCPDFVQQTSRQLELKTDRFWDFQEQSNTWVEVQLPVDLLSCVNENCTKVALTDHQTRKTKEETSQKENDASKQKKNIKMKDDDIGGAEEDCCAVLPQRKRISMTKMSDTSIWVTGESGSICEVFWNGVQWVIAPHDLQISAANALSVR